MTDSQLYRIYKYILSRDRETQSSRIWMGFFWNEIKESNTLISQDINQYINRREIQVVQNKIIKVAIDYNGNGQYVTKLHRTTGDDLEYKRSNAGQYPLFRVMDNSIEYFQHHIKVLQMV